MGPNILSCSELLEGSELAACQSDGDASAWKFHAGRTAGAVDGQRAAEFAREGDARGGAGVAIPFGEDLGALARARKYRCDARALRRRQVGDGDVERVR